MGQTNVLKCFAAGLKPLTIAYRDDGAFDLPYNGKVSFEVKLGIVYKVPTGIHVQIPEDKCGIIFERSGLGAKYGIQIFGRVIDSSYRGEIGVLLGSNCWGTVDCMSGEPQPPKNIKECLMINPGDRLAQMVIVPKFTECEYVKALNELSVTVRGEGGFGSSGKA